MSEPLGLLCKGANPKTRELKHAAEYNEEDGAPISTMEAIC